MRFSFVKSKNTMFIKKTKSGEKIVKVIMPLAMVEKNGFTYFILYDKNMKLNIFFYDYINKHLASTSISNRMKKSSEIRMLYVFLELYGYDINDLDEDKVLELILFLSGETGKNSAYIKPIHKSSNKRSKITVINQLSTYRLYLEYSKINCTPFLKEKSYILRDYIEDNLSGDLVKGQAFSSYINYDDYKSLENAFEELHDEKMQIVLKLVYFYGLTLTDLNCVYKKGLVNCDNYNFYLYLIDSNAFIYRKVEIDKRLYFKLKKLFLSESGIHLADFNKRLKKGFEIAEIKRDDKLSQNLYSMLRRGYIYRRLKIFGSKINNMPKTRLAEMIGLKNISYLNFYINAINEES